jgi:acyl-CoA thioesterase-1
VPQFIVYLGAMLMAAMVSTPAVAAAPGKPTTARDVHVLAFGDSLFAGYGLPGGQGFAPQLQDVLRREGVRAFVTNAGVSGDTTTGGRARLAWTLDGLKVKPDLVLLELGANDLLRGVSPAVTRENLDAMLAELKRRGLKTVVAGMLAPPNVGPTFMRSYNAIYPELAAKYGAPLYPFILNGVVGNRALVLPDNIHPNAAGVRRMVTGMLPVVMGALPRE